MRRKFLILLFFVPKFLVAQEAFSVNFLTILGKLDAEWQGDLEKFVIIKDCLQLFYNSSAIAGTTAYLSRPSQAIVSGVWQAEVQLKAATSSANYVRIYLAADRADLSGELNGYFVMIGGTADEISLYKQAGKKTEKIIDGADKRVDFSSFGVVVKAVCDENGNWELFSKLDTEAEFVSEGKGADFSVKRSEFAGIFLNYSVGNIGKYFVRKFSVSGEKIVDNEKPQVVGFERVKEKLLRVDFSEEVRLREEFAVKSEVEILSAKLAENGRSLEVEFGEFERGKTLRFEFVGVEDLAGNALENGVEFYVAKKKDVVFTEIFFDTEPSVGLPNVKFFEIFNHSGNEISLENWSLEIGKSRYKIGTERILPNEYKIVCAEKDKENLLNFGTVLTVSSLSSLTLSGTFLGIFDEFGRCVDWVQYENSWLGNDFKKEGGWSLERVDTERFTLGKANWKPSISSLGGTPGQASSVRGELADEPATNLEILSVEAADTILLVFNKEIDEYLCKKENFSLSENEILNAEILSPFGTQICLTLAEKLTEDKIDTLKISELAEIETLVTLPVAVENFNDVVLNEVLFYKKEGGSKFVEIYNQSEKTFALDEIRLSWRKNSELQKLLVVSEFREPIFPGEYVVFAENAEALRANFDCPKGAKIREIALPPLTQKEDNLGIFTPSGAEIEFFAYNENLHHAFLTDRAGVSLERVHPSAATGEADSWHSAASTENFATPGRKNSQFRETAQAIENQPFALRSKRFSPDNDGFEDALVIDYNAPEMEVSATVEVFTPSGDFVKKVYNNKILASSGELIWDGTDRAGRLCNPGVYVVLVSWSVPGGRISRQKLVCSLTSR